MVLGPAEGKYAWWCVVQSYSYPHRYFLLYGHAGRWMTVCGAVFPIVRMLSDMPTSATLTRVTEKGITDYSRVPYRGII